MLCVCVFFFSRSFSFPPSLPPPFTPVNVLRDSKHAIVQIHAYIRCLTLVFQKMKNKEKGGTSSRKCQKIGKTGQNSMFSQTAYTHFNRNYMMHSIQQSESKRAYGGKHHLKQK